MKKFRRPITWGLLLTLAFLTSAGELLHYLPGCAHYTRQPDGSLLLAGRLATENLSNGHDSRPSPPSERTATEKNGHDDGLPILDVGECAICVFSGLQKQTSQNVSVTTNHFLLYLPAIPSDAKCFHFETTTPPVRGPPSLS